MTIWALFLAVMGIALCVYGANHSLGAKLGEVPTRQARMSAATGRLATRTGIVLLVVGAFLFVVGIVIHTIQILLTLLLFVLVVAVILGAWGRVRRPRVR